MLVRKIQGICYLVFAQLLVGMCIVGGKSLTGAVSGIEFLLLRFCAASIVLLSFYLMVDRQGMKHLAALSFKEYGLIGLQGLCAGVFYNVFIFWGLHYTRAAVAGGIMGLLPILIVLCSVLFLKERLSVKILGCLVLSIVGLWQICGHDAELKRTEWLGDVLILISLIPEAIYYLLAKRYQNRLHPLLSAFLMCVVNVPIILGAYFFYTPTSSLVWGSSSFFRLLCIGAGSGFFFVFWLLGCDKVSGVGAGLTTAFMPVSTMLCATLFLHESIHATQVLGMMLIVMSMLLHVYWQHDNF